MIFWPRVTELRDEIGAEDFGEVVELFLDEVDAAIAALRGNPDRARLGQDLHFLKGSALNLGFSDFSDICETGERSAAAGRPEDVDIAAVVALYDASRAEFIEGLRSHV